VGWKGLAGFASGKVIATIIATSTAIETNTRLLHSTVALKGACNEQIYETTILSRPFLGYYQDIRGFFRKALPLAAHVNTNKHAEYL